MLIGKFISIVDNINILKLSPDNHDILLREEKIPKMSLMESMRHLNSSINL